MRVLQLHNRYRAFGGEDRVVESEARLLREAGVEIRQMFFDSSSIRGPLGKMRVAWDLPWSESARLKVLAACREFRPAIVHVHNFFPLATPSVFSAAIEAGAKTVLTLHNFRLFCSNGLLFRDGKPCELCLDARDPAPAVEHACYQGSRIATVPVARMVRKNRDRGTWANDVHKFIALSEFSRDRFLRWGVAPEKLVVKPNFLFDPGASSFRKAEARPNVVFVGRLSEEKGLRTLLRAKAGDQSYDLQILGEGPLESIAREAAGSDPSIYVRGFQSREGVQAAISAADLLVFPSECYENFPVTLLEAMALSRAVVVSRLGALQQIVPDGVAGFSFKPGDAAELRACLGRALADRIGLAAMGASARSLYLERYEASKNLASLRRIYEDLARA